MNGFWFSEEQEAIREGVLRLCARFDADYWRRTDETGHHRCSESPSLPRLAGLRAKNAARLAHGQAVSKGYSNNLGLARTRF